MEQRYFFPKSNDYGLNVQREGDYLTITTATGAPFDRAGSLISSCGGVDAFWARCISLDRPLSEELADRLAAKKKARDAQKKRILERTAAELETTAAELAALGSPIETTPETLRVLARYLRVRNWGTWKLPAMSIPYTAAQYDCDGTAAVTIILDTPIMYGGELVSRFQYGAPHGHLPKYHRIR